MTLIELLNFIGLLAGLIYGAVTGFHNCGLTGLFFGAVLGAISGTVLTVFVMVIFILLISGYEKLESIFSKNDDEK